MAVLEWAPYEVPQSLWSLIELYAPTVELSEIKHIIGDDLIEQSQELLGEVQMLLDIWEIEEQHTSPPPRRDTLPESPYLREQMIAQIQQFVGNLDATKNRMLQGFLKDRRAVYDYAVSSRPSSSGSNRPGTPSRPSSRSSIPSSSVDLTTYRENISAFKIDQIVGDIRAAFREEHRVLRDDIDFLHTALTEQHERTTPAVEPSLGELQMFASELERKVLDLSQPVFTSIADKKPSSPKLKSLKDKVKKTEPVKPSRDALFEPTKPSATRNPEPARNPSRESLFEPAKPSTKSDLPQLPPTQRSQLSWRQRTLRKVNMPSPPCNHATLESLFKGTELRGDRQQQQQQQPQQNMVPKPPPPRRAFAQEQQ